MPPPDPSSNEFGRHVSRLYHCLQNRKINDHSVKFYTKLARGLPLRIDPFADIEKCIFAGIPWATDDEGNRDDSVYTDYEKEIFARIIALIPAFQPVFNACVDLPPLFELFAAEISRAAQHSRTDDTGGIKKAVLGYFENDLGFDDTVDLQPMNPIDPRTPRWMHNTRTAFHIIPHQDCDIFRKDPNAYMASVLDKTTRITENAWPSFLYPAQIVYNPDNEAEGLFRGPLLVRVYRHIFTSPSSALDKDAKAGKRSQAEIHKITSVEPHGIAYAAVLARHALVGTGWKQISGGFNYHSFYQNIVGVFERNPNGRFSKTTLKWWSKQVNLARSRPSKRDSSDDEPDTSNVINPVDRLYAQMDALEAEEGSLDGEGSPMPHNESDDAGSERDDLLDAITLKTPAMSTLDFEAQYNDESDEDPQYCNSDTNPRAPSDYNGSDDDDDMYVKSREKALSVPSVPLPKPRQIMSSQPTGASTWLRPTSIPRLETPTVLSSVTLPLQKAHVKPNQNQGHSQPLPLPARRLGEVARGPSRISRKGHVVPLGWGQQQDPNYRPPKESSHTIPSHSLPNRMPPPAPPVPATIPMPPIPPRMSVTTQTPATAAPAPKHHIPRLPGGPPARNPPATASQEPGTAQIMLMKKPTIIIPGRSSNQILLPTTNIQSSGLVRNAPVKRKKLDSRSSNTRRRIATTSDEESGEKPGDESPEFSDHDAPGSIASDGAENRLPPRVPIPPKKKIVAASQPASKRKLVSAKINLALDQSSTQPRITRQSTRSGGH